MKIIKVNVEGKGLLSMRDIGNAVEEKLHQMKFLGTRPFEDKRHMVFQLGNTIFVETQIKRSAQKVGVCMSEIKTA